MTSAFKRPDSVINLGTNNQFDSNSLDGNGTIIIGAGSTLTSAEYNGFTFFGGLSGSGALILGSQAGSAGGPYTAGLLGASPNFSGSITDAWTNELQVGAATVLGDASATNTLILDSGSLQATGNASLAQNITIEDTQGISTIPNTTTIDTQTNTLTLTGHISGGNSLLKIGTGAWSSAPPTAMPEAQMLRAAHCWSRRRGRCRPTTPCRSAVAPRCNWAWGPA